MPQLPIKSISALIPQQAPRYVQENYPLFLSFIAAYFEWLEQGGNAVETIYKLPQYFDIDTTINRFLSHFHNSYLHDIPQGILANPVLLEHHIKTFYRARGSEKAYELLFQILFNTGVKFYYPSVDILKPSDGKWTVNQIIRTTSNNDTFQLVNTIITGVTSKASAAVESVIQIQLNGLTVSEIQISNIIGNFILGEQITNPALGITETTYELLTGSTITNPGTGYSIGDKVTISGGGGNSAKAEVIQIGGFDTGRVVTAGVNTIQLANFANPNNGFYNGMTITIVDGTGANQINVITAYNGGTQTATVENVWIIIPDITSHYSVALGQVEKILIEDFGISFITAPTLDLSLVGNGNATASSIISTIGSYPGFWLNNDSFLDSNKFLQDDVFYQAFSYVLKTTESINHYRDIVNTLLHPAGTILFGEVDIESSLEIGPTWKTLEMNKFKFPPYQAFTQTYPSPNASYFGDPFGPANTQIGFYLPFILNRVINTPNEKRNEVADAAMNITTFPDSIPTNNILAIYDMVQGVDAQVLYDKQLIFSPPRNGFLGTTFVPDPFDPVWNSVGQNFANKQFDTCDIVPVNPLGQTVMVVYQVTDLSQRRSAVGCIDADADSTTTGYSIAIEMNGQITFRVQKNNFSIINNLTAQTIPNTAILNQWQVATLRYSGNKIRGNINNNLFDASNTFVGNVDGLGTNNNSFGWVIGNQGFIDPIADDSLYGISLFGRALGGFSRTRTTTTITNDTYFDVNEFDEASYGGDISVSHIEIFPSPGGGNPFVGNIAYVIIWNAAITDNDVEQSYFYLKNHLVSRGINLP